MNVLDRLDQLEREGAEMRVTVIPSEDGTALTILDHVAVNRAHLRALLDVARAAELIAAEQHNSTTSRFWDTIAISQAALVPLLEETDA